MINGDFMDWYNEEREPNMLNYLALAYTIKSGCNVIPSIAALQDKAEAKERIKAIKKIRAEGGKTELEQLFPKWKHENKSKHKVYLYDIELHKKYVFESKNDAIRKLKLKKTALNKVKETVLIDNRYIASTKHIKIKEVKPAQYLYILETSYPKGLFWIETDNGNKYLSIDSRRSSAEVKKHDCKEAAILHLINLSKKKVRI